MGTKISYALELLTPQVLNAVKTYGCLDEIDEIRLRLMRRVSVSVGEKDYLLDCKTERQDIEHTFKTAFSYSVHSYSKELSQGYITTSGGNRVGISGTAVTAAGSGNVETVKYITSINIRIAREVPGCADGIIRECFGEGLCGVLVTGPPSCGKTTVLRDITRQLGSRYKISLIDERGEISAALKGEAQNDVGELTDVFFGYPKAVGIDTALRVMSPRAIVADEIGEGDEERALRSALHSGVRLITAVHAFNADDALKKPVVSCLAAEGAFKYVIELNPLHERRIIKLD